MFYQTYYDTELVMRDFPDIDRPLFMPNDIVFVYFESLIYKKQVIKAYSIYEENQVCHRYDIRIDGGIY